MWFEALRRWHKEEVATEPAMAEEVMTEKAVAVSQDISHRGDEREGSEWDSIQHHATA